MLIRPQQEKNTLKVYVKIPLQNKRKPAEGSFKCYTSDALMLTFQQQGKIIALFKQDIVLRGKGKHSKYFSCQINEKAIADQYKNSEHIAQIYDLVIYHTGKNSVTKKNDRTKLVFFVEPFLKDLYYYYEENFFLLSRRKQINFLFNHFAELLSVVETFHQKGNVHLDLKPENFLIDQTGKIALTDLDAAKKAGDHPRAEMKGTARMLSPERMDYYFGTPSPYRSFSSHVDYRDDVWSLGCYFYYLLKGHLPNWALLNVAINGFFQLTNHSSPPQESIGFLAIFSCCFRTRPTTSSKVSFSGNKDLLESSNRFCLFLKDFEKKHTFFMLHLAKTPPSAFASLDQKLSKELQDIEENLSKWIERVQRYFSYVEKEATVSDALKFRTLCLTLLQALNAKLEKTWTFIPLNSFSDLSSKEYFLANLIKNMLHIDPKQRLTIADCKMLLKSYIEENIL